MIKSFCSYNAEEQDLVLVVIEAQLNFLHFFKAAQGYWITRSYSNRSALKDNKMVLGAVEAQFGIRCQEEQGGNWTIRSNDGNSKCRPTVQVFAH